MRVLLCVFFALAFGQTGLRFRTQDREAFTNQQEPTNGQLTADEKNYVFLTSSRGRGNFLYSVPGTGNFKDQKLISQANVALPNGNRKRGGPINGVETGVQDFLISPDNSYVLFTSKVESNQGKEQQFTVGIGGGAITEVTPKGVPPAQIPAAVNGQITYRPCPCNTGSNSDQWYQLLASSFGNCNAGFCSSSINEIWRNTRSGDAKKLNVELGQKADEPGNKAISILATYSDYIFYTANPGANGLNDPIHLYMADWNGNNWKVTSTSTLFRGNASQTIQFTRSASNCQNSGKYVAFTFHTTSLNYQTVNLFNIDSKSSITISPDLDLNSICQLYGFTGAQDKFFFNCNPSANTNQNVYEYKTAGGTAARAINGAYAAGATGGVIAPNGGVGDYFVYTQTQVATGNINALFSYNIKTEAAAVALFTETDSNSLNVRGFADKAGSWTAVANTMYTNTARVWYTVGNGTNVNVFTVAVSGAAGSGTSVVSNLISANLNFRFGSGNRLTTCNNIGAAPKCEARNGACRCTGCASVTCSAWVFFTARVDGETETNLWSAQYDGTGLAKNNPALTTNTNVATIAHTTGHSFANPELPLAYFYATTGTVPTQVTNLYVVRAGSTSATQIGSNPVPQATATGFAISTDRKWIAFHSQTAGTEALPLLETYIASADGVGAVPKVSPSTLPADTSATGTLQWAASKYLIHFLQDNSAPAENQRNIMYASSASLTPTTRDIALNSTFGNSIGVGIMNGGFQLDCSQTTVIYQTQLLGSPTQIYTVSLTEAKPDTVCVSFNPFINVGVQGMSIRSGSFRVDFSGRFFSGQSTDRFWNTASGSMLMPSCIALLALLAAMLF